MDLLLIFFLLGLILQGIKVLFNYWISRSDYFEGPILSQPDETEFTNQLSPVLVNKEINQRSHMRVSPEINSSIQSDQTKGKEVFMPSTFNQSA